MVNCKALCLVRCHFCVLWSPVSLTVVWHGLTFLVFYTLLCRSSSPRVTT